MGQILFTDKIGQLTYSNPNVNMLSSISSPSYITIGGQQYTVTANLSVSTGSLTANNLYFVYAVQTAGVVSLAVSTNVNSIGPAGFASWKLIGAFYSDASSIFNAFVSKSSITPSTFNVITSTTPGTYTPPPRLSALRVRMVAAGGGGSASGQSANTGNHNGSPGGNTTFGTLTATGGNGCNSAVNGGDGGGGNGGTIGSGWSGEVIVGSNGQTYAFSGTNAIYPNGGDGGGTPFGEGAKGTGYNGVGKAAQANTGGGGGGGGANEVSNSYSGLGGGGGGYIDATTNLVLSSYSFGVGVGGAGSVSAGSNGNVGGAGGSGKIIIEEIKPNLEQLKDL